MSSFKSSKNIQKKEVGSDRSVLDNQSSSVTLNELAMKARKSYCNFKLQQRSHTMTDINPNEIQMIEEYKNYTILKRCSKQTRACIQNRILVSDFR